MRYEDHGAFKIFQDAATGSGPPCFWFSPCSGPICSFVTLDTREVIGVSIVDSDIGIVGRVLLLTKEPGSSPAVIRRFGGRIVSFRHTPTSMFWQNEINLTRITTPPEFRIHKPKTENNSGMVMRMGDLASTMPGVARRKHLGGWPTRRPEGTAFSRFFDTTHPLESASKRA